VVGVQSSRRSVLLWLVRYGIGIALIVAGFVILVVVEGSLRWDGWAMCVGGGLSLILLNVFFRFGAQGDHDRVAEDEAREYFARHGHWPDERPPRA
jgi:hypothetical protein